MGEYHCQEFVLRPEEKYVFEMDEIVHIQSDTRGRQMMGFVLQWSGVAAFQGSDEPLVMLTLEHVR